MTTDNRDPQPGDVAGSATHNPQQEKTMTTDNRDPQPVADPATDPQPVAVAPKEEVDTRKIPTIEPYAFAGIIERVDPDSATDPQPGDVATDPAPVATIVPMQTTIPGCGLDPVVPPVRLAYDIVECSDGTLRRHYETFYDCCGHPHSSEEDAHESNVEIVTIILDNRVASAEEYATENEDFASSYDCLVNEDHVSWKDRIDEWVCDKLEGSYGQEEHPDYKTWNDPAKVIDRVAQWVFEHCDGSSDCEVEFDNNEYAAYSGKGCCIGGFDIGEQEDQIGISDHPELSVLHGMRLLDDCLDDYNGDASVSRSKQRVKNEKTGYYEPVGRETYMTSPRHVNYPTFEIYYSPGGRWDFVVSEETMNEWVCDCFEEELEGVDVEDFDIFDHIDE